MNTLLVGAISGLVGAATATVLVVGGVTTYKNVTVSAEQPAPATFTTYADE